jgi:hypothetical protein
MEPALALDTLSNIELKVRQNWIQYQNGIEFQSHQYQYHWNQECKNQNDLKYNA